MNINRKQFIAAAAGLTGGAFLPGKLSAGTTAQIPVGQIKITDVKPYVLTPVQHWQLRQACN